MTPEPTRNRRDLVVLAVNSYLSIPGGPRWVEPSTGVEQRDRSYDEWDG